MMKKMLVVIAVAVFAVGGSVSAEEVSSSILGGLGMSIKVSYITQGGEKGSLNKRFNLVIEGISEIVECYYDEKGGAVCYPTGRYSEWGTVYDKKDKAKENPITGFSLQESYDGTTSIFFTLPYSGSIWWWFEGTLIEVDGVLVGNVRGSVIGKKGYTEAITRNGAVQIQ